MIKDLLQYNVPSGVSIGPLISSTDGVSPVTGLTLVEADFHFQQEFSVNPLVQDYVYPGFQFLELGLGLYAIGLTDTMTNALGNFTLYFNRNGVLPWKKSFEVRKKWIVDLMGSNQNFTIRFVNVNTNSLEFFDGENTFIAATPEPGWQIATATLNGKNVMSDLFSSSRVTGFDNPATKFLEIKNIGAVQYFEATVNQPA